MDRLPLVLAIEPDLRQAAIIKRIVREQVHADVAVVDSRDAAIQTIGAAMPDVILLSALLSPRDEDDLIAHLRTLEGAEHLQTHTIPQLASSLNPRERGGGGGLLSAFRRKKEAANAPSGCDPDLYAEEIRLFLQHAAQKKKEAEALKASGATIRPIGRRGSVQAPSSSAPDEAAPDPTSESSWASPFEWKPAKARASQYSSAPASAPASPIANRESRIPDPVLPEPVSANPGSPDPASASPAAFDPVFVSPAPVDLAPAEPAVVAPMRDTLIAQPGTGLAPGESLIQDYAEREAPIVEPAIEASTAAEPIVTVEPIVAPEPIVVPEPLVIPEPVVFAEPAPIEPLAASQDLRVEDSGTEDSESGIQDEGSAISDSRLGPLASWARAENSAHAFAEPTSELRAVLASLAVPLSVGSVSYGRGCRIRRVRVKPGGDGDSSAVDGAVILSKRALAELRSEA